MQSNHNPQAHAQSNYQKALSRAFWRNARQWLGRGCNDLFSFQEVFEYIKNQTQYQLGLQTVPIEQIVGSSGRLNDFDLAYNPRHHSSGLRWINVAKARFTGVQLPPILLYKVGEAYFVEDGNHRVSVARANGEKSINANVIEIDVSNLIAKPACTRLGYKLEDKSFE